jgi:hypothetical protein
VSADGKTWTEAGRADFTAPNAATPNSAKILPLRIALSKAVGIRYVRIQAKNQGVCPPWHAGAGAKSWLFVDEIGID